MKESLSGRVPHQRNFDVGCRCHVEWESGRSAEVIPGYFLPPDIHIVSLRRNLITYRLHGASVQPQKNIRFETTIVVLTHCCQT
jgi:hypothetical protein